MGVNLSLIGVFFLQTLKLQLAQMIVSVGSCINLVMILNGFICRCYQTHVFHILIQLNRSMRQTSSNVFFPHSEQPEIGHLSLSLVSYGVGYASQLNLILRRKFSTFILKKIIVFNLSIIFPCTYCLIIVNNVASKIKM